MELRSRTTTMVDPVRSATAKACMALPGHLRASTVAPRKAERGSRRPRGNVVLHDRLIGLPDGTGALLRSYCDSAARPSERARTP